MLTRRMGQDGQRDTGKTFGAIALAGGAADSDPTLGKVTSSVRGEVEICLACMYRSPLYRARPHRPARAALDNKSASALVADTSRIEESFVRSTSSTVIVFGVRGRPETMTSFVLKSASPAAAASDGKRMTSPARIAFFI
jgi:hypothetical protein